MKSTNFNLVRYDGKERMVVHWKDARFYENENGEQVQEHLYVKTLFIGIHDTIENYIEVPEPVEE